MDFKNKKWIDSLESLFNECKYLTSPIEPIGEKKKSIVSNIEKRTFYCLHVKMALENGAEPVSWEEWSKKEAAFDVSASAVKAVKVDK